MAWDKIVSIVLIVLLIVMELDIKKSMPYLWIPAIPLTVTFGYVVYDRIMVVLSA